MSKLLLCLTCNEHGLKKNGENYQCIFCGSYFDKNQNIIDDWNKIKNLSTRNTDAPIFNGLGIA